MTSVYLLAHCDDEYPAWPLLRADRAEGRRVAVFHLTRPAEARSADRRRAESLDFLSRLGVSSDDTIDLAAETGVRDGRLLGGLDATYAALRTHLARLGPIARITAPAWEGGHLDHDLCAVLAVALGGALAERPPLRQFSLYHGHRTPGLLFRSGPLAGSGATERIPLVRRDWLHFAMGAVVFGSQRPVFSTLWPALFASYLAGGYRVQALTPDRVLERPHPGLLLYERRGRGDYGSVARQVMIFLRHAPASDRPDLART